MSSRHDPFAQTFDSIEIDPSSAPSKDAIDHALSMCAPPAPTPESGEAGFYLLDDAGGRFVVDREFGVVSLKDEALLANERNAVHQVRLRVIESSGLSYDLDLNLRLTGRVPQVVGAEDLAAIAGIASGDAPPAAPRPAASRVSWTEFAPARGAQTKPALPDQGPFGALLRTHLPAVRVAAPVLTVSDAPPPPAVATAIWSL